MHGTVHPHTGPYGQVEVPVRTSESARTDKRRRPHGQVEAPVRTRDAVRTEGGSRPYGQLQLLLLAATLTFTGAGCRPTSPVSASILPDTCRLEAGDVVFRRCTGLTSTLVVRSDTGGIFSHTGIVVDSAGVPMIVHAVPGEPDFSGDPDRVKMTAPRRFYTSGYAVAGAVCRPHDREAGRQAARKAVEVYRRGTLFDHDYNDRDTTRMYCTEVIVHAYRAAGVELIGPERRETGIPLMRYRCIMPSQLYHSAQLELIYMFNP